jgi:hypothetical protein
MPTSAQKADTSQPARPRPQRGECSALARARAVLGSAWLTAYPHPALREALAAADVVVPLATALILLAAVLRRQHPDLRTRLPPAALDHQPARTASASAAAVRAGGTVKERD